MSASNELRVFISSTFRDLQEEREHLVKKIFPEIRALCRERGVIFTDVDLRWGLTEEEAMLGRVIRTCLEEVDKCRPYFIGMIGHRYGWAPEYHEIMMDPDLLAKYPWIEDVAMEGVSVTEMEFIHGVFDAPEVEGESAFFYRRSGEITESDDPRRLASLIERARATGRPFREFTSIEELGRRVRDDLVAMIDRYWPQSEAPSELELERRSHAAFAASRLRAHIPNPLYLKAFTRWLADGSTPLILGGDSGLGKSSLVAYLVDYYRRKNPTALVIEHYVGASRTSGSAVSLMRHVIEEIRARFAVDEELPANEDGLATSFPNWLFRCEHLAAQAGVQVIIVVDAVNQLGASDRRLAWLPKTIPQGIRLIVSTTPGETDDRLAERGWERLTVTPLDDERVRQSIVVRYLGEFHKGITPDQVRRVTSDPKASSPLYLRVVAEELRLHGEHETLDESINRYVVAEDLLGLFDVVLERIEHDYGAGPLRDMLSAIGASRAGLGESELLEIIGMNRLELSRLLFAFDYHLIYRDGLVGFFHNYLHRAVEIRYLSHGERPGEMRRLAEYFAGVPESSRSAREMVWLYRQLDDVEALRALLGRMSIVMMLDLGGEKYEVLAAWKELVERGVDPAETYRQALADFRRTDPSPEEAADVGALAAKILGDLGEWDAVREILEEALHHAEADGYRKGEASAELLLARLCMDQGKFDEALLRLQRGRQLYEQEGDHDAANRVADDLGIVYTYRGGIGDTSRAMEYFRERLAAYEQSGNRTRMAALLHNIGVVSMVEGRLEEAIDQFERGMEINTSLGHLQWLVANLNAIGEASAKQGCYDRALECHERALKIAGKLGDRNKVITSMAQIGSVNLECGDYDRALEYARRSYQMFMEMGDQRKATVTVGLIGEILKQQGEYDGALDHLGRALDASREMGAHANVALMLWKISDTLLGIVTEGSDMPGYLLSHFTGMNHENWETTALQKARGYAEECVEIAGQLHNGDLHFYGRVVLARVMHRLQMSTGQGVGNGSTGSMADPLEALREMLEAAVDDTQRAELHYWLCKLDADRSSRNEAIRLYAALLEKTPRFAFRRRFDELAAAVNAPEEGNGAG